ncbi:cytochrome c oxidase subunit II [Natronospirillum operosum]|uniref:Cytochrome c oxidase subunit 2 n=1 Tax=Natronospirillum operosum TaxID=2759953 RepID=A0A4Z0W621_9GAMM|nr:cytochrome c oxidase subunit II [Natronospirillum operosum]TGG91514.1 cytochrome c oxidase subunit II [Natronospirillum operosum]
MLKRLRPFSLLAVVFTALMVASSGALAGWELNMRQGVTEISQEIYSLHMLMLYIVCIIGVLVFGVMFWAMFKYRKSKGAKPATWHENTRLEVLWTVIPLVILIGMAVPATVTLAKIYDTPDADITVKVNGYQWRWEYTYLADTPEEEVSFFSSLATPRFEIRGEAPRSEFYLLDVDNPLVIPANTPVKFLITANDVIHSWWVPDFGIKKDAVPGIINESHATVLEPGTYRGMCAELCGRDHAYMPIVVEVLEPEEFEQWLAEQRGDVAAAEQDDSVALTSAGQVRSFIQ